MAQIRVDGQLVFSGFPKERADGIRAELKDLEPGGVSYLEFEDEDGDRAWVRIPYEASVVIMDWDA